jgi:hypothetical protein
MRIQVVAAALLLSPLMVHAQANTPAQPQAAEAPALHASVAMPAGLMSSSAASADVPAANPSARRVSTGVVAPKLIHTVPVEESIVSVQGFALRDREAWVSMIVDETGKPSDLKIVQSAGADLDQNILNSVSQYRYQPGSVSGKIVAVPVNLHVVIRASEE